MAYPLLGFAPASMAGDANGLSIGLVPPAGKSAFDSTASNEIVKPHATVVPDQKSDHGPKYAASAPVRGLVVNQQPQLAPPSAGFCPLEFQEWVTTVADADLFAVEAFLLGDCRNRQLYPKMIKDRTCAPVSAMNETPSLEQTLDLFAAGVDDVVRKPIHVRKILARVGAIRRRNECERDSAVVGDLRVFFDGRDPQLKGVPLSLPRRERRILEYLVNNRGRREHGANLQFHLWNFRRECRGERR